MKHPHKNYLAESATEILGDFSIMLGYLGIQYPLVM